MSTLEASSRVLALLSFSYSEFARVFGVDFRSVRTRGSQFKVESVLFKLSKPESFMMLSPSRTDVSDKSAHVTIVSAQCDCPAGRSTKRRRVSTSHYGTAVRLLQRTARRLGLHFTLSLLRHCSQLLLVVSYGLTIPFARADVRRVKDLPRPHRLFQGKRKAWDHESGASSWPPRAAQGSHHRRVELGVDVRRRS